MPEKRGKNTKKKIVSAAWKLFYEQGYENTTVDEIIVASGTSRGSFYHYFSGKDALLGSLSFMFDEKYEELIPLMDSGMDAYHKLLFLNQELFSMIEDTISIELLAKMYSTQLTTTGERHLMDHKRIYYRLIRQIAVEGQSRGELRSDISVNEITKIYALCERALLYDWCLCGGNYSLRQYARSTMPMFLAQLRTEKAMPEK